MVEVRGHAYSRTNVTQAGTYKQMQIVGYNIPINWLAGFQSSIRSICLILVHPISAVEHQRASGSPIHHQSEMSTF